MDKAELLNWLQEAYQQWQALLDQIGPERMDQPGVNGDWSMKDLVAHVAGTQPKLTAAILAAQYGEPEPPPPWPASLAGDDAINAWIYESNRGRSVAHVLNASHQTFLQYIAVIEGLPEDAIIEPEGHVLRLGDQCFPAGEFFDHFHDAHEPEVRAWLARVEKQ